MMHTVPRLAVEVLLWTIAAEAVCDVCGLRNPHSTKDYSTPFPEGEDFPACGQYKDASCCDLDTVQNIKDGYTLYQSDAELYDVAACDGDPSLPKMSKECKQYFQDEYCFYECDVNLSRYRKHHDCENNNSWEVYRAPIKASWCNAWYDACKEDYMCVDGTGGDISFFAHAELNKGGKCTQASGNCKKFSELYETEGAGSGGKGMCNNLWFSSFIYDETDAGMVMSFPVGSDNPNDAAYIDVLAKEPCESHVLNSTREEACGTTSGFAKVALKPCEACHLRNDHSLDIAEPQELSGVCSKYADNACCSPKTAEQIDTGTDLYGPEYRWSQCYELHPEINATLAANNTLQAAYNKCDKWFKAEECLYECDVNAGKWRKHATCTDGSGMENAWQIVGMPLMASECDQFYADCSDLVMCSCLGDECTGNLIGKSLGLTGEPGACGNTTDFCQRTVKEIWTSGKDWCESLWDQSFVYEEHEAAAYSMAWGETFAVISDKHESNPNNAVKPLKEYPQPCAEVMEFAIDENGEALETEELCPSDDASALDSVADPSTARSATITAPSPEDETDVDTAVTSDYCRLEQAAAALFVVASVLAVL